MKTLFFLFTFLCVSFVNYAQTTAQKPSIKDRTYQIENLSHLRWISEEFQEEGYYKFILLNDIDASETSSWNNGKGFKPIDLSLNLINFDGSYYTISNLVINRETEDNVGFFRNTINTYITNLSLKNLTVKGSNTVGGLISSSSQDAICLNIFIDGDIQGNNVVGGIIGRTNYIKFSNVINFANVKGKDIVSGLIGELRLYSSSINHYIRNSQNHGSVSGETNVTAFLSNFTNTQYNFRKIINVINTGLITSTQDQAKLITSKTKDNFLFCYNDFEKSGINSGLDDVINLSTSDFSKQESFDESFLKENELGIFSEISNNSFPYPNEFLKPFVVDLSRYNSNFLVNEVKKYYKFGDEVTIDPIPNIGMKITSVQINNINYNVPYTFTADRTNIIRSLFVNKENVMHFDGGDGSEFNPYLVSTLKQLQQIDSDSKLRSNFFALTNDIDASNIDELTYNQGFLQIEALAGLDGRGYTISNLKLNGNSFIGTLSKFIKNLTLKNVTLINAEKNQSILINKIITGAVIENVHIDGTIDGDSNIGFFTYDNQGVISNCSAFGTMSGIEHLAGFAYVNNGAIDNSIAIININATNNSSGFTYTNENNINNCISYSTITLKDQSIEQTNIGGFVSEEAENSNIENSYWSSTYNNVNENVIKDNSYYRDDEFMGIQENFPSFDFDKDWAIGKNNSFSEESRLYLINQLFDNNIKIATYPYPNLSVKEIGIGGYNLGDTVRLSIPEFKEGFVFSHWEHHGENVGRDDVYEFIIDGSTDNIVSAHFDIDYTFFAGGKGTPFSPLEIDNLAQLKIISEIPHLQTLCFNLIADIDAYDTRHWNEGKGFTPIKKFYGKFNGQGHYIKNLYINRPEEDEVGLFSFLAGGKVYNLNLRNVDITGNSYVGGIAGRAVGLSYLLKYIYHSKIINCSITGDIKAEGYQVGGFVGFLQDGYVKNSYSDVNVTGKNTAGGIVGLDMFSNIISRCYSVGIVNISEIDNPRAGGISSSKADHSNKYYDNYYQTQENDYTQESEGVTVLTEEEFTDPSNFNNWQFDSLYVMNTKEFTNFYNKPVLKAELVELTSDFYSIKPDIGFGKYYKYTDFRFIVEEQEHHDVSELYRNGESVKLGYNEFVITKDTEYTGEATAKLVRVNTKVSGNCRITPSNPDIMYGFDQLFTFDVGEGEEILNIVVNGDTLPPTSEFLLERITESSSIEVIATGILSSKIDKTNLSIYPNPTYDNITIETNVLGQKIEIINIHGRVYKTLFLNKLKENIDLSRLPKGLYFIKMRDKSFKVIKN
ncbi:T9SS type A sorting domain-containing protein [Flammeovirga yaeyamensis]|uniref:T9SS type A sorting domain-containing protein n=1 Tax=Flammeovirga yaeyamensis TaxID=367791 RepID=A0AAX1NAT0_9BACT|nr:T9SS type A sorting domain-containing protein [Flammeovirga yaeyamensis]MBB3699952.1 hypothetical protein [Flammeovirga yaeyamensis]NMF37609.1 T9SS type A sorting domain-containing protein [Flammeovirga yaeyamensis]QWG04665.1 T9SS type A sorting domain-containing protein [Flammeovirga yaeyamensis]